MKILPLMVFLCIFAFSNLSWAGGSAGGSSGGSSSLYEDSNDAPSSDPYDSRNGKRGYGPAYTGCVEGTLVAYPVLTGHSGGDKEMYTQGQAVCENNEWVVKQ